MAGRIGRSIGSRKGFVITILSIGLIALLVMLAIALRNSQLSQDRALVAPLPLLYAASIEDDAAFSLNSLIGPSISLNATNSTTGLLLSDRISGYNFTPDLASYSAFMKDNLAGRTASNISLNLTNISSMVDRVYIDEDYIYTNDRNNRVALFTKAGGTGASAYFLNITVPAERSNVTYITNTSGALNLTIIVTDLNGTIVENTSVSPSAANVFSVGFISGGVLTVSAGSILGNSSSLQISSSYMDAPFTWYVILPRQNSSKRLGFAYDATINYTQGRVSKAGRIGK